MTTNNAQSACVEFGSCSTAGGNGVVTATQNAPVTAPAGTPALATYTTLDSAFISSLAAAGASAAYTGGASRANALTSTRTVTNGGPANTASSGGRMGLGGLASSGNSNASPTATLNSNGGHVMGISSAVVQLTALSCAVVLGAALLL